MKQRLLNFYTARKAAIWWTVGYIACTYAILKLMFNFSIFSAENWHRLMHAHLHGFAGFVFGILILAMVPLYVATTAIVLRKGKPLFTIPMPNLPAAIKKRIHPTPPEPKPEPEPDPNIIKIADAPTELPPGMPLEMRAPYMRVRRYGATVPIADTITATENLDADTDTTLPGELPVPSDFDFDAPITDTAPDNTIPSFDMPVFSDINFDAPDEKSERDTSAATQTDADETNQNAAIMEYLRATGREFTMDGDVIISGNIAIASHTDNDFWITEGDAWFATGKTRTSPISALQAAAAQHNVQPVLYLGAMNIMDLDTHRADWESAGIKIITTPADIAAIE